ncbi:MAG: hypothetical protein ABIO49_16765 [Dokdonella sp.]
MKRHTRTNLFLIVMVALLGFAVYAELRKEDAIATDPLFTLDLATVHTVSISCKDCTPRRFEKIDGHWRMLEPFAQAADDARIERIVAIARAPVRFRHVAGDLDAKKLGLEPPWASLRLDDTTLTFGTTDAIHGDRYVMVGGTIALVPDRFSALLFTKPESELATPPVSTIDVARKQ